MKSVKMAASEANDLTYEVTCHLNSENVIYYKCSACESTFPDITKHLKEYHPESNTKAESDALAVSEDEDKLNDEDGGAMAFVIKNAAGKYECTDCNKTYKSLKRFVDHVKSHGESSSTRMERLEQSLMDIKDEPNVPSDMFKTEREARFCCKICSTVFDSRKKLILHSPIHKNVAAAIEKGNEFEATEEIHHCKLCNRSLRTEYEMELHMKAHEENNTNGLSTSVQKQPKRKRVVGEKSTYPCQYCKKEFKRPHEKVKHERVHTGEKPFGCDLCGKQFRVTYCLSLHKRNVHSDERPYICTFEGCEKRFKSQSVYNHHLNTHGTEKNFKCPYCSKAFKTSVQLAGHKNTHTKPFACQVCSRAFASLYAVRIHMEVHRNEETALKFTCKICLAQYGRKFALSDHMKTEHPEEPVESEDDMHFVIEEIAEEVDEEEVYSVVESGTSSDRFK